MIKAIETAYKGYRFRSRLEARWAVFFDALKIKWQYELEGFALDGIYYLPDFFLPEYQMYCEIKPAGLSDEEIAKVNALAMQSGHPCLILIDAPNPEGAEYIAAENLNGELNYTKHQFAECTDCMMEDFVTHSGVLFIGITDTDIWMSHADATCHEYDNNCNDTQRILEAAILARSARFEHGERVMA